MNSTTSSAGEVPPLLDDFARRVLQVLIVQDRPDVFQEPGFDPFLGSQIRESNLRNPELFAMRVAPSGVKRLGKTLHPVGRCAFSPFAAEPVLLVDSLNLP
jgi:hypothetical protein